MNILIVHNPYQIPGGEDEVVRSEIGMLKKYGHNVVQWVRSNTEIERFSFSAKVQFAIRSSQISKEKIREVRDIIRNEKIQLAHVHNTFLAIGPSVYQACREEGIPVVQTLHNYRFLCPNGLFYRAGHICSDCLRFGRIAAVANRCWRNSFAASFVMAKMVEAYHTGGILTDKIQHYVALSGFSRRLFVANGFPEDRISVKPNFLDADPGAGEKKENYAIFVGGFFSYKGVETLIEAWRAIGERFPLKMIGDGPLLSKLRGKQIPGVDFLGRRPLAEALNYLRRAKVLVVPSECYENFPRVIVEAFACGVPVAASNLGAMPELIAEGETGTLFDPHSPRSLAEKIDRLIAQPSLLAQMGNNSRREFERKYTQECNYSILMEIYSRAMEQHTRR